jgi:hypothetical protein
MGTGVPTTPDVWVEVLFKTIRHGAHDALPEEYNDTGSGASRINAPEACRTH